MKTSRRFPNVICRTKTILFFRFPNYFQDAVAPLPSVPPTIIRMVLSSQSFQKTDIKNSSSFWGPIIWVGEFLAKSSYGATMNAKLGDGTLFKYCNPNRSDHWFYTWVLVRRELIPWCLRGQLLVVFSKVSFVRVSQMIYNQWLNKNA